VDTKPRQLTAVQQKALRLLAQIIMTQLNFRRQSRQNGPSRADYEQLKGDLEKLKAENIRLKKVKAGPVKHRRDRR
jgi:hypothetical protein